MTKCKFWSTACLETLPAKLHDIEVCDILSNIG